jgi:hypothetical protein
VIFINDGPHIIDDVEKQCDLVQAIQKNQFQFEKDQPKKYLDISFSDSSYP